MPYDFDPDTDFLTGASWDDLDQTTDDTNPFGDVVLGVARGAAGAAESILELIPGLDFQENFGIADNLGLGRSSSTLGGLVEGVTSFMVGFIPVAGWMSRAAKAAQAGKALGKVNQVGAALGSNALVRGTAAGAAADFMVWDGNDPRLSNLVQEIPGMQNSITEFLAADENDNEYLGRFKNALEGMGLGVATEGVLKFWGAVRARNAVTQEALTAKEPSQEAIEKVLAADEDVVKAAAELAIETPHSEGEVFEKTLRSWVNKEQVGPSQPLRPEREIGVAIGPEEGSLFTWRDLYGVRKDGKIQWNPRGKGASENPADWHNEGEILFEFPSSEVGTGAMHRPESGRYPIALDSQMPTRIYVPADGVYGSRFDDLDVEGISQAERNIKSTEFAIEELKEAFPEADIYKFDDIDNLPLDDLDNPQITPRELVHRGRLPSQASPTIPRGAREVSEQAVKAMNLGEEASKKFAQALAESFENGTDSIKAIDGLVNLHVLPDEGLRAAYVAIGERVDYKALKGAKESLEESAAHASEELSHLSGVSKEQVIRYMEADADGVRGARRRTLAYVRLTEKGLNDLGKIAQSVVDGREFVDPTGRSWSVDETLLLYKQGAETMGQMVAQMGRIRREFGLGLGNFRRDAIRGVVDPAQAAELVNGAGGSKAIQKSASQFLKSKAVKGSAVGQDLANMTRGSKLWAAVKQFVYASMLSGPATHSNNLVMSALSGIFHSMERALGGTLTKLGPKTAAAMKAARQAKVDLRASSMMATEYAQIAKWASRVGEKPDAVTRGVQAGRQGQSVLDYRGTGPLEQTGALPDAINSQDIGDIVGREIQPDSTLGAMLNYAGTITEIPGKLMMGLDEYVKQATYAAHFKAELYEQASEAGLKGADIENWANAKYAKFHRDGVALTRKNLKQRAAELFPERDFLDPDDMEASRSKWIEEQLQDAYDEGLPKLQVQGLKDLGQSSFDSAVAATHQQSLAGTNQSFVQDAGAMLQRLMGRHPAVMFFTPFVKTPTNLLDGALRRTPLPFANPDFTGMVEWLVRGKLMGKDLSKSRNNWIQEVYSNDPKVRNEAIGRMATAVGVTGAFGLLASEGVLTGRGPEDHVQRQILEQTGWQPYSVKLGDTYVSYRKWDPFASLMGYYADAFDIMKYADPGDLDESVFVAPYLAMLSNLKEKSYLTGLNEFVGLLTDFSGDRMEKTVGRIVGLGVPTFLSQARGISDPHQAELAGLMDRVYNRIPGFNADYGNKRRNIIGEPMTKKTLEGAARTMGGFTSWMLPIEINTTGDDAIDRELADLAYSFSNPAPQKYGADLRDFRNQETGQSAYDRWMELKSQIKLDGRTLRSALKRLINSKDYRALPDEGNKEVDENSPKVALIQRLVGHYSRAAEREMFKEFPEVRLRFQDKLATRHSLWTGQDTSASHATLFPLDQ